MRRAPQGRPGLPSRRLHLPRLSRIPRAALWFGALVTLGVVFGLAAHLDSSPAPEDERRLVALLLFGQDDADAIVSAALHGLGGRPVRIAIERVGPCRYAVAAEAGPREVIAFDRVVEIRQSMIVDPASMLARTIDRDRSSREQLRERALVILTGAADAVCNQDGCFDRRVFALNDPSDLEKAGAAAATFRARFCPGSKMSEPAGSVSSQ